MKTLIALSFLTLSLLAQEETTTKKVEGGLIHTKQEERYEVVTKLPEEAAGFDQAFDYAKPFATFRLANVTTKQEGLSEYNIDERKTSGSSFGGIFGFDTASLYGMHLHLGAYVSRSIH